MSYPFIILSEDNHEIKDCTVLHALKDLLVHIHLYDGHEWEYAEVTGYSEGVLFFTVDLGNASYQVMAPITTIESITYT